MGTSAALTGGFLRAGLGLTTSRAPTAAELTASEDETYLRGAQLLTVRAHETDLQLDESWVLVLRGRSLWEPRFPSRRHTGGIAVDLTSSVFVALTLIGRIRGPDLSRAVHHRGPHLDDAIAALNEHLGLLAREQGAMPFNTSEPATITRGDFADAYGALRGVIRAAA